MTDVKSISGTAGRTSLTAVLALGMLAAMSGVIVSAGDAGMAYADNSHLPIKSMTEIGLGDVAAVIRDNSFGVAVAEIGDLDNDGIPDIAVGAPGATGSPSTGSVYILLMNNNGTARDAIVIDGSTDDGPELKPGDRFGASLASVDGLESPALAVGAPGHLVTGIGTGDLFLIFLNPDGTVIRTTEINAQTDNGPKLGAGDRFGVSVASIDGLESPALAVGAPGHLVTGIGTGDLFLIFLNSNGTIIRTTEINASTADGLELAAGDRFASSVGTVELDGAGPAEILVGAPGPLVRGASTGAVHVLFVDGTGHVENAAKISAESTDGLELLAHDRLGASVAGIADVSPDGTTAGRIAIGTITSSVPGYAHSGALHVLSVNATGGAKYLDGIDARTENGPVLAEGDQFGVSVASIGDLDGNGADDLAAGSLGADTLHVMLLNPDGTISHTMTLDPIKAGITPAVEGHQFGYSTANIGDLDADGFDDLAVGAPGSLIADSSGGEVHIMFMSENGTHKAATVINAQTGNGPTLGANDRFGSSIAGLGDLDGDDIPDIAVGAPGHINSAGRSAGDLFIMYMNSNGTVKDTTEINDSTENGPALSQNDRFGASVAMIGDLDGNGAADLAVGAPGHTIGLQIAAGEIFIILMNPDNTVKDTIEITRGTENGPDLHAADRFGTSVTGLGDLDGDDIPDIAVGAPGHAVAGVHGGDLFLLFMNSDGTVKRTTEINGLTAAGPLLDSKDSFGWSVENLGDLDNDGIPEIAVGAPGDIVGPASGTGNIFVIFLNHDGTVKRTTVLNEQTPNSSELTVGGRLGLSVAGLGDLDSDGGIEIAIGSPGSDSIHIAHTKPDQTHMSITPHLFFLTDENVHPRGIAFTDGRFWLVDKDNNTIHAYHMNGKPDTNSTFALQSSAELRGITATDSRLWLVDTDANRVHAYGIDGNPIPGSGFALYEENSTASGITFADGKFWVTNRSDHRVYAYNIDGTPDLDSGFALSELNTLPSGITFADGKFWVPDRDEHTIYAYTRDGIHDAESDIVLDAGNLAAEGITFTDGKFWVPDADERRVYAYVHGDMHESSAEFSLDHGNTSPNGLAFADGKFWLTDFDEDRVYVYNATDGARLPALEFLLHPDNAVPNGITATDGMLWVADLEGEYIHAYAMDGTYDGDSGFALAAENTTPTGIDYVDGKFWVIDFAAGSVFAYTMDGTPDSDSGFALDPANSSPFGITLVDGKFWITDLYTDRVYAYTMDGTPDSDSGFALAPDNGDPAAIQHANGSLWVPDTDTHLLYQYDLSTGGLVNRDSIILLDTGNTDPTGVTFGDGNLWSVDFRDPRVYSYKLDGTHDFASEFLLDAANSSPAGITFADGMLWVVDLVSDRVFAYRDGVHMTDAGFGLAEMNTEPAGIAHAKGKFWILDLDGHRVYAYDMDGTPDAASGFQLSMEDNASSGITFALDRFWVTDSQDNTVFAYLDDGTEDIQSEFTLDVSSHDATGIAFADGRFWVVDSNDTIYAYVISEVRGTVFTDVNRDGMNNDDIPESYNATANDIMTGKPYDITVNKDGTISGYKLYAFDLPFDGGLPDVAVTGPDGTYVMPVKSKPVPTLVQTGYFPAGMTVADPARSWYAHISPDLRAAEFDIAFQPTRPSEHVMLEITMFVDANNNGVADPNEGVPGLDQFHVRTYTIGPVALPASDASGMTMLDNLVPADFALFVDVAALQSAGYIWTSTDYERSDGHIPHDSTMPVTVAPAPGSTHTMLVGLQPIPP